MGVLANRQHRLVAGESGNLFDKDFEGALLPPLRRQIDWQIFLANRYSQQFGDQRHGFLQFSRAKRQRGFDFGEGHCRRIRALEPGGSLQKPNHRIECAVGVIGRAITAQWRVDLMGEASTQRVYDTRFTDPGLAAKQHDLTLALLRALEPVEQQTELVVAPDQRRQAVTAKRLEPVLAAAFVLHPIGAERLGKAFEPLRGEIDEFEQVPKRRWVSAPITTVPGSANV